MQLGSALAYRAIPLQSAYCGAKFAVRGFTDAVRTELLHGQEPAPPWLGLTQTSFIGSTVVAAIVRRSRDGETLLLVVPREALFEGRSI